MIPDLIAAAAAGGARKGACASGGGDVSADLDQRRWGRLGAAWFGLGAAHTGAPTAPPLIRPFAPVVRLPTDWLWADRLTCRFRAPLVPPSLAAFKRDLVTALGTRTLGKAT